MKPEVGDSFTMAFEITPEDMALFQKLSGDFSRIHVDDAYAKACGFKARIAYGGIVLAKLSKLLGSEMPGDLGVSLHWSIDFRKPLLVGRQATLELTVKSVSESTGVVESSFRVRADGKTAATGRTQSMMPGGFEMAT